ncbi:MAG: DUF3098 domain-containing protein [Bacteroidales bacterium]|nr:DUF3098 domain-containing protein [Bacteroidales bacterium]
MAGKTSVFNKQNYILLIVALLVIITGYTLMGSKTSSDSPKDIYSFSKITLAPVLVIAGYVLSVYSIFRK